MLIKDAMNPGIISISENKTPIEAFEKMYKNGVRRLFVVDKNSIPVGVIAYSDLVGILEAISEDNNNEIEIIKNSFAENDSESEKPETSKLNNIDIKIKDIMARDILTINGAEPIKNAANLMLRVDISGILVMDNKKPVGVITKTDICRLVAAGLLVPKN
ncbi:MAG: CBS domain-containing protein [Methanobacteriaceae archaeon]